MLLYMLNQQAFLPHELEFLEEEDGWKLFKSTLYKIEKDCPRELEEVGRSILGKCGGLPLAIKLIGGLLSTKKETREAWSNVLGSFPWHLNEDPVQYSSILAMSYYDLPSYLQPCFRYFATFLEGFQIREKRLIRLWIEEEGIIEKRAEEELEDIGKDYIEELADRLTVLDLEGTYKPKLPKELGWLIHLRYLGLRHTWLYKLPSSIADLFELQTLDLKCTDIQVIPSAIWEMQHLRHLYLNGGSRSRVLLLPSRRNNSIKSLSMNLRTLCGIYVGPEDCVTKGLKKFTKIRKLAIEGDLVSHGKALIDWIGGLERLEHLKLRSTASTAGDKKPIETSEEQSYALPWLGRLRGHSWILRKLHLEGKLEDFRFLYSLKMLSILTLVGTRMRFDAMHILGDLQDLRILRLWYNSYVEPLMHSFPGSFPKLEVLEVCWLDELKYLDLEEGSMPNLRELEINKCNKLSELPYGLEYLTNLKELRLPAMSDELKSRVLPNTGEDWYKIKHIPFISPPLCSATASFTAAASASAGAVSTSSSSYRLLFDRMLNI